MGYHNLNLPKNEEIFPEGLIVISGRNSYGKSTILEGILFAFFGPSIFIGRKADSFITYGQDQAELYVFFILDDIKYYIFRKWGRTGSTSIKLFEMEKRSNKYREIKDFNLTEFFEISKEQALNTVFVRQGEIEELANIKGAQLRDMLINLFRLDIIDDSLKYLDQEMKLKKLEKSKIEKTKVPIERIEADINRVKQQVENDTKEVQNNKRKKKDLEKELMRYPPKNLISELENQYRNKDIVEEKYKSYKQNFESKIQQSGFNVKDFSSIEKIDHTLRLKDNAKSQLEEILSELNKKKQATIRGKGITRGKINDLSENINLMKESFSFEEKNGKSKIAKCPTCQSELTKEHYDEMMKKFENELKLKEKKMVTITELIEGIEIEIKGHQEELDSIKRHIATIQGLKYDYSNYHVHEKEVMQIQHEIDKFIRENKILFKETNSKSLKSLREQSEKIINELKLIEKDITKRIEDIESNEKRIKELTKEIEKMKELEKKIGDIEIDLEHFIKAKEYVRRFVTEYMVVKRLVKNIALKTDRYIKDFTSGQYSDLILDLFGTKKTGLSLKIKDHFNGQYESIEVLSGGDRTALGIALRLAISELMSIIRPTKESPKKNPKINFLLLDEPLAALDENRRERILKYLIKSKTFSQIFLITHTAIPPDIQTHKILVEKDHSNGQSNARFERSQILY